MSTPFDDYYFDDGTGGGTAPPSYVSGDWARIGDIVAGHTEYRSINFGTQVPAGSRSLNGTYTILAVAADHITLSNPDLVQAFWDNLAGSTAYSSPSLSTTGERWVGPFTVNLDGCDTILVNVTAEPGLYRVTSKGKQYAETVGLTVEVTPIDENDDPSGPAETYAYSVTGSAKDKDAVQVTLTVTPTFQGRSHVRVRRTTPTDPDFNGTLVDEVKWRDAYGLAPVAVDHFGNVTTVHTRTYATASALSVKDRKLNLEAIRKVPHRTAGTDFDPPSGTARIDDIITAVTVDPYIGNRALAELDLDNLYDTVAQVQAYFGDVQAVEFGYTFDDDNTSFEETLALIANVMFCRAYRQGSVIRFTFEGATELSKLLFNHRNILPRTQQRSVSFGVVDDHDGVELDWMDPKDGATLTYRIPYDRSAVSPNKLEVPGILNAAQTVWHAWRAWMKLKWQSVTLEQECTQEAAMALPTDRVLITDQTRPPDFEGDVRDVDGLDLRLSQPVDLADDLTYTIFLQMPDETVEAITVTARADVGDPDDAYWVTLANPPTLDLTVVAEQSALPTYLIVSSTDRRSRAYLVTEREPQSNFTETLRAINYSPMYYITDELEVWLPFSEQAFRDQSSHERGITLLGDAALVNDGQREKWVFVGADGTAEVDAAGLTAQASYSTAAWANVAADAAGGIVSGADDGLRFFGDGTFGVFHGGATVAHAYDPNNWHYYAATYDQPTQELTLYMDGEQVASAEIARGALAALTIGHDLVGRLDDVRYWKRALTPAEVVSLFRSTRVTLLEVLAGEDGVILTTEDGQTIGLE